MTYSLKNNLALGCFFGGFSLVFGLVGTSAIKALTKRPYPWATSFICMGSTTVTGASLFAMGFCSKNFSLIDRKDLTVFFILHMTTAGLLTHIVSKWWIQSNVNFTQSTIHTFLTNLPLYTLLSGMTFLAYKSKK